MSKYELHSYRRMSHMALQYFGLKPGQPPKPRFMMTPGEMVVTKRRNGQGKNTKWTPTLERDRRPDDPKKVSKRQVGGQLCKAALRKKDDANLEQLMEKALDRQFPTKPQLSEKPKGAPQKKKTKKGGISPETNRRYPQRESARQTNYVDIEVPDDDMFLFCADCEQEHLGDCPVHGPLIVVKDSEAGPADGTDPTYAYRTLPSIVTVRASGIPKAGKGVWALQDIPRGARFGPYKGQIRTHLDDPHKSGYSWEIYRSGEPSHFVDAVDESRSNWLRFINSACHLEQQNLVAFQYQGEVYYRSVVPIRAGTELLVWYGTEYGRDLGICADDSQPTIETSGSTQSVQDLACDECDRIYLSELLFYKHRQRAHGHVPPGHIVKMVDRMRTQNRLLRRPVDWSPASGHRANLNAHVRAHTALTAYTCQTCGKGFKESGHLKRHVLTHKGQKPHKCQTCGKGFKKSAHLEAHIRIHTGEKPYKCQTCGKGFKESGNLNRHVLTHKGQKPHKCQTCGKGFKDSGILKRHVLTHKGQMLHKCQICGKGFNDSVNLNRHVLTHKGQKPHKCQTCGKDFMKSAHLNAHTRIHTGEKPYRCETCGKGFNDSSNLKRHVLTHTGEKPYNCPACGKGFKDSGNLKRHVLIHTGEKPYRCETCGKGFRSSYNLHRHALTQTEEKPFKCPSCDKGFHDDSSRNSHVLIHTMEKPYICRTCGKGFNRSANLNRHILIHTGEKPYKCPTCGKGFSRSDKLNRHVLTHAGGKP